MKNFSQFPEIEHLPYQLIENYNWTVYTQAIAFNFDGTIIVFGCHNKLKICQFRDGQIKKIQEILNCHTLSIQAICFYNQRNSFFSSGEDQKIKLWHQLPNIWQLIQVMSEHDYQVPNIIINRKDIEFISCSFDGSIKIWNFSVNRWKCKQTLDKVSRGINCISYNKSETQIVSCGFDDKIIIWQFDNEWKIRQIITNNPFGSRISFLGDHQIAFQPQSSYLMLFEYSQIKEKYYKIPTSLTWNNDDADAFLFPIVYNNDKKLLIDKQGYNVYILSCEQKLKVEQIIKFNTTYIFGTLTKDAEYLVIWDSESELIQVRKLRLN